MAGFGGSVKLTGESEYKKALKEIKEGMKNVGSELKLMSAQFQSSDKDTAKLSASSAELSKKIAAQKESLGALKQQYSSMASELATQSAKTEKLTSDYDKEKNKLDDIKRTLGESSAEYKQQAKVVDDLSREVEESAQAEDKMKLSLQQMSTQINNTETSIVKAENKLEELNKELNKGEDASGEFADGMGQVKGGAEKATGGLTTFKVAIANLVANVLSEAIHALKDFVAASINAGKDFEAAMSKVGAVSGATSEDLALLTEKAKEMGANTKFSATESAEAFNYMAMAGWKTQDMIGGIEGILNLAAASGADLATTSDIVTDALTAFGQSAEDAGRLADIMAAASSNANTNVQMMGETFKYVAPVAGALKFSMEDTAVAIGLMANAGIKGSQAGTALRSVFSRLASPPKEAAEAMAQLGLEITNSDGSMKSLAEIIGELRQKMGGLTEAEQAQIAKALGGQEAMSGLLAIVNAAPKDFDKLTAAVYGSGMTIDGFNKAAEDAGVPIDALREELEKAGISADEFNEILNLSGGDAKAFKEGLNEAVDAGYLADDILFKLGVTTKDLQSAMDNSAGAAEAMAAEMQDNLSGDLTRLNSQLEGVQISMFEGFEPAMRAGVSILSGLLKVVGELIAPTGALGIALRGAVAGITAFTIALNWSTITSAASAGIGVVITALKALGAALLTPPTGIIVLLASLVVIIAEVIKKFFDEEKAIKSVKQAQEDLNAAKEEARKAEESYIDAIDSSTEAQKKLEEAEKKTGQSGADLFKQVQDGTLDYANMTDAQKEVYKAYLQNEDAQRELKETTEALAKAKQEETKASFENDLALAKEGGSYDEFKAKVVAAYKEGTLSAQDARDLIGASMSEMSHASQQTFMEDLPNDIREGLNPAAYETHGQKFVKYWEDQWQSIKDTYQEVKEYLPQKFGEAWEAIKAKFSGWAAYWKGLWDKVKETFKGLGPTLADAIGGAVKQGLNAVIAYIERQVNKAIGIINRAISMINEIPGVSVGYVDKVQLPRLAKGGIIDKPTIAEIGEAGKEAVIPLENNTGWIKQLGAEIVSAMAAPIAVLNQSETAPSATDNYNYLVDAFKDALTGVKVQLDDEDVGSFVLKTVSDAIY